MADAGIRRLQLSSEDSRTIIDALPLPLFAVDRGFRIVAYNRAGRNYLGEHLQDGEEPDAEQSCYAMLYARNSPCPYCPAFNDAERVFFHDRPVEKLIQQRRTGGEEASLRITFSRADSPRIMMLETIEDITAQRQKQEEALRKENLAALGIMISGIAHELNNPLTGMGLNLQNLQANLEAMDPTEIQKRMVILKKDLQQASRIVQDILSFSRPGQLRLAKADILQTAEKAAATTRRLYPVLSRQTEWKFEGESTIFTFDPEKVERLFINLFRNSIQALDYGAGYIRVDVRRVRKSVHIIVEDNAGGIQSENLKNIFKPFYTGRSQRGSGLGLTICHSIVREHDGRIHVRSFEGKTRFYIALPLMRTGLKQ